VQPTWSRYKPDLMWKSLSEWYWRWALCVQGYMLWRRRQRPWRWWPKYRRVWPAHQHRQSGRDSLPQIQSIATQFDDCRQQRAIHTSWRPQPPPHAQDEQEYPHITGTLGRCVAVEPADVSNAVVTNVTRIPSPLLASHFVRPRIGGGRIKSMKDFNLGKCGAAKQQYSFCQLLWEKVAEMVRGGNTVHVACDNVYAVYGERKMCVDRYSGIWPAHLMVQRLWLLYIFERVCRVADWPRFHRLKYFNKHFIHASNYCIVQYNKS
jgi:hypothetical protein